MPVSLEQLRDAVERHGPVAYLLTVSDDVRPHAVSTPVGWDGDRLALDVGARSQMNANGRPLVSLLWPPVEPDGYSLIVDGDALVTRDGVVLVIPTKAVLHRSAGGPDALSSACGSDCIPLTGDA